MLTITPDLLDAFDRSPALARTFKPPKPGEAARLVEALFSPEPDKKLAPLVKAVRGHAEASRLLIGAEPFRQYTWEVDGMPYGCTVDAVGRSGTLLNFRVLPDNTRPEFVRNMLVYESWHRRAALEAQGHAAAALNLDGYFVIVVGGGTEVAVYRLSPELMAAGAKEAKTLADRLVEAERQDNWRAPHTQGIQNL